MIHNVSVLIVARESVEGCYVVTARAVLPSNRQDESLGAVPIEGLKGEARSNAMMKAETKAKRRVTLAICGLGFLDESEVDSIKGATQVVVNESGEVVSGTKEAQSEVVRAKLAGEIPLVAPGPPLIDPRIPGWGPPDGYVEPERAPKVSKATGKKIGATLIQIVQAFGDIKKRYQAIGQEGAYYAVLKNHGVEKSNQFQNTDEGVSQARQAYKAMVMDVQELEVAAAKAREAGEGVPECFRLPDAMEQDIGYRLWLKTRDGSRKIWTVVEAPNADGPDRIWQEVKQ